MTKRISHFASGVIALALLLSAPVVRCQPNPSAVPTLAKDAKQALEHLSSDDAAALERMTQRTQPGASSSQQTEATKQAASGMPSFRQESVNSLAAAAMREIENGDVVGNPNTQLIDSARLFVFISLGMPEGELKTLFRQAANDPGVVFVLRGYDVPHLSHTVTRVHQIAGEPNVNVIIDPTMFREYEIDRIPVFLGKQLNARTANDGKPSWFRVVGTVSVTGAESLIAEGRGSRTTQYGPTFAISEPDALAEFEKRAAQVDWTQEMQGAADRLKQAKLPFMDLPAAKHARVRSVDLTIMAQQNLALPDGRVFVRKGTRVNPLDYITLAHDYLIFDGTDADQIAIAQRILKTARKPVFLMATRFPDAETGKPLLHEQLGQSVYNLTNQVVDRFRLESVPSLVVQDGKALQVKEIATNAKQ
jgi:conjugal transfer pilus assembly protein TraW